MMKINFGDVVRKLRIAKGKRLVNVAKAMGWSAVYLSDIERGKRNPPSVKDIRKLAEILEVDPGVLLEAAARSQKPIDLTELPPNAREVALALMRKSYDLTEEEKGRILEILGKNKREVLLKPG